jgi:hypothetical protein
VGFEDVLYKNPVESARGNRDTNTLPDWQKRQNLLLRAFVAGNIQTQ